MGPKRSAKGSKNQVPGGSEARIAIRSQHGPQIDPKWAQMGPKLDECSNHVGVILGQFWDHDGIILGSFWGHLGIILGSFWGHDGIILGSFWGHVGILLGPYWGHVGVILASCWYQRISPKCCGADFGSRIKISGNLLGQNDQNFEIYPFDWSQVAS